MNYKVTYSDECLAHHGIFGMKWGVRRFQNEDGTLTKEGLERYRSGAGRYTNNALEKYQKAIRDPKTSDKKIRRLVREVDAGSKRDKLVRDYYKHLERHGGSETRARLFRTAIGASLFTGSGLALAYSVKAGLLDDNMVGFGAGLATSLLLTFGTIPTGKLNWGELYAKSAPRDR